MLRLERRDDTAGPQRSPPLPPRDGASPARAPPRPADGAEADDDDEMEEGECDDGIASLVVGELSETWMEEAYVQHLLSGYGFGAKIAGCRVARDFSTGVSLRYAVVQLRTSRPD